MVQLPRHAQYIGGKWVEPVGGEHVQILDPATNRPVAEVASGGKEDVGAAVDAARRAFESPEWRGMDPSKRGRLLYQVGQGIRDRFDELARIESLNVGKPIKEAKGDVAYVYKLFEYYAGLADKIQGDTIPVPGNRLDYTLREPVGVTGHIAPWNYPLLLACRGIAPALAAGNTVVLKPASLTPLTALTLAELASKAGLPPGVFNVVTGPGSKAGTALASHPDVDSMTFTGSTETGKQIMQLAARNVTRVTLELGGKNPNIVFPDAKLDRALKGVMSGIFQNAGQMCWAGSRLFVHEAVRDEFLQKLADAAHRMRLGPGTREDTQMGPLVSREQEASVLEYIASGTEQGATLLAGGKREEAAELREGNFVMPTVFGDVEPGMRIAREEIFGPVLAAFDFADEDEVVGAANASEYGLFAGVWTQNLQVAHRVAARLECGMVSINEFPVTFPQTPFSGFKQSALGYEQGVDAVLAYTRVKNVNVNLE
jgi:aldehyde dehydrogenase (NAD+)